MNKRIKLIFAILSVLVLLSVTALPAFAAEEASNNVEAAAAAATDGQAEENTETDNGIVKSKIIAAAALIGLVAAVGAVAMGWSITGASKNIARQPEAAGNIRTNVMLGLVFIETAIIYALIVAILIIFVL